MNANCQDLAARTRALVVAQVVIGLVVALVFYHQNGPWSAASVGYGTMVSVAVATLLYWSVSRASAKAAKERSKSAIILYLGGAQRFFLVLALFGFGLAVLKLEPVGMVMGFGFSQIAHVFNLWRREAPVSD